MQNFKDPATGQYWALDDDVVVTVTEAGREFRNALGDALTSIPSTLVPVASIPTPEGPTLDQLRAAKEAEINASYAAAAAALAQATRMPSARPGRCRSWSLLSCWRAPRMRRPGSMRLRLRAVSPARSWPRRFATWICSIGRSAAR